MLPWISCSERLPEDSWKCLIALEWIPTITKDPLYTIKTGYYASGEWVFFEGVCKLIPRYWLPLTEIKVPETTRTD